MTLDKQKKKELADAYVQTFRPMGIYQIRNMENGKVYVDASMDLDGMRNRFEFSLKMNNAPFLFMKEDWARYGGDRFAFEVLDRLEPEKDETAGPNEREKYRGELDALLELWLEKLQPYGEMGYNKRKK